MRAAAYWYARSRQSCSRASALLQYSVADRLGGACAWMLVSYRTLANTSAVVETREESVGLGESGLSRMAKAGRRARVRATQSLRGRNRAVAQGSSQGMPADVGNHRRDGLCLEGLNARVIPWRDEFGECFPPALSPASQLPKPPKHEIEMFITVNVIRTAFDFRIYTFIPSAHPYVDASSMI